MNGRTARTAGRRYFSIMGNSHVPMSARVAPPLHRSVREDESLLQLKVSAQPVARAIALSRDQLDRKPADEAAAIRLPFEGG